MLALICFQLGAPPPRPDAIVHLFDVDQPFETLESLGWAAGHPVVVSTIHHARAYVRRMRAAEPIRGRRALSLMPESVRAFVVYSVTVLRSEGTPSRRLATLARAAGRLPFLWRRLGRRLDQTDAVLVLSDGERRWLQEDFGTTGSNIVLTPNGGPEPARAHKREPRILVVGRIEARKRQLEALRAAEDLGVALTFVGTGSPNQRAYSESFAAAVSQSVKSNWLGALPHAEVTQLMANSTVLLNCSWAEVQSLVDLEAAAAGCWVVSTADGGASKEWLGGAIVELGADDVDAAVKAAEELRARGGKAPTIRLRAQLGLDDSDHSLHLSPDPPIDQPGDRGLDA